MSDRVQSDRALSDQALSDRALSDRALSDQALSDQALSDQALSDQALSDQAGAAPCVLCGSTDAARPGDRSRRPACPVCGWLVGDAPDPDLPRPVVEVVYYIRWHERIKIGTSSRPAQRLAAIWHEELLAFERGGRALEQQRHREFADLREGGEWFRADPVLLAHTAAIARGTPPWHSYARWTADALRDCVS